MSVDENRESIEDIELQELIRRKQEIDQALQAKTNMLVENPFNLEDVESKNNDEERLFPGILHPKKRAFLIAYSLVGTVMRACQMAHIDRKTHYNWMQGDPDYVKAFGEAQEEATERLEQEVRRRAFEGTKKAVYYKGQPCGIVTEYSDVLAMFLLKGERPDKYQDRVRNEIVTPLMTQDGHVNTLKQLQEVEEPQKE